jgi:hypothetical protein
MSAFCIGGGHHKRCAAGGDPHLVLLQATVNTARGTADTAQQQVNKAAMAACDFCEAFRSAGASATEAELQELQQVMDSALASKQQASMVAACADIDV